MGESAGLYLWKEGGAGNPGGSSGSASAIAVSTSTAAPSRSRSRANCRVTCVLPMVLTEIMESRPAIPVNWRSSGMATAEAIVSGLPPGRAAETTSVGKSTLGRSLTGRARYASTPKSAMASIRRLVAMGRRIHVADRFTENPLAALFAGELSARVAHLYLNARGQPDLSLGDHRLPALEPVRDDDVLVHA